MSLFFQSVLYFSVKRLIAVIDNCIYDETSIDNQVDISSFSSSDKPFERILYLLRKWILSEEQDCSLCPKSPKCPMKLLDHLKCNWKVGSLDVGLSYSYLSLVIEFKFHRYLEMLNQQFGFFSKVFVHLKSQVIDEEEAEDIHKS